MTASHLTFPMAASVMTTRSCRLLWSSDHSIGRDTRAERIAELVDHVPDRTPGSPGNTIQTETSEVRRRHRANQGAVRVPNRLLMPQCTCICHHSHARLPRKSARRATAGLALSKAIRNPPLRAAELGYKPLMTRPAPTGSYPAARRRRRRRQASHRGAPPGRRDMHKSTSHRTGKKQGRTTPVGGALGCMSP